MGQIFAIAMLLCFWQGDKRNRDRERAAVAAAEVWLDLVDRENYAASWEEAASYFKGAVSQQQWLASMQSFRKPLGEKLSRTVKSQRYHTSLPGAPDGEYVVIQFQTAFTEKKSAIETLTPMLDADGKWRVSGYYIN